MVPDDFSYYLEHDACVKIVDLAQDSWRHTLYEELSPKFLESPDAERGQTPFLELLKLLKDQLRARSAVVEPYVGTDWNEEYGHLYSRAFKTIDPTAQRIHFFSEISTGSLKPCDLFNASKEVSAAYLGYIVLRPIPAYRVSETLIKSPWVMDPEDSSGDDRMDLVHCQAKSIVSLLGNELSIRCMPFMQQDTSVGVCAEADLWMVARYANLLGDAGRYRPATITSLATKTITVGPPREGLIDLQILDALRHMGLNAVQLTPKSPQEAREFIYTCVESNLPVIAGIPNHVVVVIGHDYFETASGHGDCKHMSDLVRNFVVHDDAKGAYLKRELDEVSESTDSNNDLKFLTLGQGEKNAVDFCIAVMPDRLNLSREDLAWHTEVWLENACSFVEADMGIPRGDLWDLQGSEDLVMRTYLRKSRDFKRDVLRGNPARCALVSAKYKCTQMPKYIWVVELARRGDLDDGRPHERKICGELIFDSTANRHVINESLIAFNYDGILYVPGMKGRPPEVIVSDQKLYEPLLRRDPLS